MRKRTSKTRLTVAILASVAIGVLAGHLCHAALARAGVLDWVKASVRSARLKKDLESRTLMTPSRSEHGFPPEAFVLLTSMVRHARHTSTEGLTVGFVVGDGTLVLTAAHCERAISQPRSKGIVVERFVFSPYYGDLFDFEVVATDSEADIAVLRPAWKTHPALRIGTVQDVNEANQVFVCGRRMDDTDLLVKEQGLLEVSPDRYPIVRMERLSILKGYRGASPGNEIVLESARYVLPGWSGSAFIRPENAAVVGLLTQHNIRKTQGVTTGHPVFGCSIRSVRALLERHYLGEVAEADPPTLATVPDANEAFALALGWFRGLHMKDANAAVDAIQRFTAIRPRSVIGLRLAGETARGLGEARRQAFQQAIDLAPSDARSYAAYGWHLAQGGPQGQALVQTEKALALDPNNATALLTLLTLPDVTDRPRRMEAATRLIRISQASPLCWFYYSQELYALGRYQESLGAAEEAAGLDPNGPFRRPLARALAKLDRLDEAEIQFKKMTELCGCQGCWTEYADFLIDHRSGDPNALSLAEQAVARAEQANEGKVSAAARHTLQVKLEMARVRVQARSSMQEAERMTRDWIGRDPNQGHPWWTLADLLRTQGRFDEAVDAAQRAVDLDPNGTLSFKPRLANCLAKAGRLEQAERTYQEMFAAHPDRALYWLWYAEYLADHRPERVVEARQALDRASDPNAPMPADIHDLERLRQRLIGPVGP